MNSAKKCNQFVLTADFFALSVRLSFRFYLKIPSYQFIETKMRVHCCF